MGKTEHPKKTKRYSHGKITDRSKHWKCGKSSGGCKKKGNK